MQTPDPVSRGLAACVEADSDGMQQKSMLVEEFIGGYLQKLDKSVPGAFLLYRGLR